MVYSVFRVLANMFLGEEVVQSAVPKSYPVSYVVEHLSIMK